MNYYNKYIKYKNKYLQLQGGTITKDAKHIFINKYNNFFKPPKKKVLFQFSLDETNDFLLEFIKSSIQIDSSIPIQEHLLTILSPEFINQIKEKINTFINFKIILSKLLTSFNNESIKIKTFIENNVLFNNNIYKIELEYIYNFILLFEFINSTYNNHMNLEYHFEYHYFNNNLSIIKFILYTIISLNNLYGTIKSEKNLETLDEKFKSDDKLPFSLYNHTDNPYLDIFKWNYTDGNSNIPNFSIISLNILFDSQIRKNLEYNTLDSEIKQLIHKNTYDDILYNESWMNLDFRLSGISQIIHNLNPDIMSFQEIEIIRSDQNPINTYQKLKKYLNSYINKYNGKFFEDKHVKTRKDGVAIFWNFIVFEYIYSTSFKITGDKYSYGSKTVGLVLLKHRNTRKLIIITTSKFTGVNKQFMSMPQIPNKSNYVIDFLNYLNNDFNLYLQRMKPPTNISDVPIIFSGDLNEVFHNDNITGFLNNGFNSIYELDNQTTPTTRSGKIIDYMFYKSSDYSINLISKLQTIYNILFEIKNEHFDKLFNKLLSDYYQQYQEGFPQYKINFNNKIKTAFKKIYKQGLYIPNKYFFSDHLMIGGRYNINMSCNTNMDCINRNMSLCYPINRSSEVINKICITKIYNLSFENDIINNHFKENTHKKINFDEENINYTEAKWLNDIFRISDYCYNKSKTSKNSYYLICIYNNLNIDIKGDILIEDNKAFTLNDTITFILKYTKNDKYERFKFLTKIFTELFIFTFDKNLFDLTLNMNIFKININHIIFIVSLLHYIFYPYEKKNINLSLFFINTSFKENIFSNLFIYIYSLSKIKRNYILYPNTTLLQIKDTFKHIDIVTNLRKIPLSNIIDNLQQLSLKRFADLNS